MARNTLNFIVDAVSLLVLLALILTGLLMRFVLPPGSGYRQIVWSLNRHEWGDVHFWLAVAVGAVLVFHVALHWNWVCNFLRQRLSRGRKLQPAAGWNHLYGVIAIALIAGLIATFLWIARESVQSTTAGWRGGRGQPPAANTRD